MKGRIIVVNKQDKLHFYWIGKGIGKLYLFSQKFSKSVFDFFCKGRSAKEVLSFKQWNRSPRLDKTITLKSRRKLNLPSKDQITP